MKADEPMSLPLVFSPREQGVEYALDHSGSHFYIRTNEHAKNFKVMKVSEASWAKKNWTELIPHNLASTINEISCFKDFMAVSHRSEGLKKISILNLNSFKRYEIGFDEVTYDVSEGTNLEFDTKLFRIEYTSLVKPNTTFDYDTESRTLIQKKVEEVLGGYEPSKYATEPHWARASDGVKIPISLVYKKGIKRDGKNPTLLEGYGAYGLSNDVFFSSKRLSLLDRGFVYAIAHVRGGGEMRALA